MLRGSMETNYQNTLRREIHDQKQCERNKSGCYASSFLQEDNEVTPLGPAEQTIGTVVRRKGWRPQ